MKSFAQLLKALHKETSKDAPDLETLKDLVRLLVQSETALFNSNNGKDYSILLKNLRALKRRAASNDKPLYTNLMQQLEELSRRKSKESPNGEEEQREEPLDADTTERPTTVAVYKRRLTAHGKELHKDPPVLPPPPVTVYQERAPLPKRQSKTLRLTFASVDGNTEQEKEVIRSFCPNQTPEEILRGGSFGGTYFRSIHSAVTNRSYKAFKVVQETLPREWIDGLDQSTYLTSPTYNAAINKYKAKCGGSLGMWESSGWITNIDVYGWFQWYCCFYQGRRTSDDVRQIGRWKNLAGPKGRFKSRLCNMILSNGRNDPSISPVIRQTLFHWGLLITEQVLKEHASRR